MRMAFASIVLVTHSQRVFPEVDPASLERLADIETLPPVPWWPPAPGWYLVMAAVSAMILAFLLARWRHMRRNAYRAAALAELDRVEQGSQGLSRIARVIKRTALATTPRPDIAGLSGERWLRWLHQAGKGVTFSDRSRRLLNQKLYDTSRADEGEINELLDTARAWIRRHQPGPAATASAKPNRET